VVEVRSIGYSPVHRTIDLRSQREVRIDVTLEKRVPVLAEVDVLARARDPTGFDTRRKRGIGHYLTADEIERRGGVTFTDVVRTVPGVSIVPYYGPHGVTQTIRMGRASASVRNKIPRLPNNPPDSNPSASPDSLEAERSRVVRKCDPEYFIDGRRVTIVDGDIDAEVNPRDIAALEVYPSGAQLPPQFMGPNSACGVVVIWTKRGRGT
jgi:hypothetical protein